MILKTIILRFVSAVSDVSDLCYLIVYVCIQPRVFLLFVCLFVCFAFIYVKN